MGHRRQLPPVLAYPRAEYTRGSSHIVGHAADMVRRVMAGNQTPERPGSSDGANAGYAAVGYLIAGMGVWGFVGWLLDRWLHLPAHIGMMVGLVVGMAAAIYLIVKRLGV